MKMVGIDMVSLRFRVFILVACALLSSFATGATLRQLTATPYITDIKISPTGQYLAIRIFDD